MQAFKIANFKKENPKRLFPEFESLGTSEALALRADLTAALGLPRSADPLELVKAVEQRASVVAEVHSNHGVQSDSRIEQFLDASKMAHVLSTPPTSLLVEVLHAHGIRPHAEVFVNWYRFDQIDRMKLDDLANNFDDVWYPSSDDIDIFDGSFSWILSVDHEGIVKLLRLSPKQ